MWKSLWAELASRRLGSPHPGRFGSLHPGRLGSPHPGRFGSLHPGRFGSLHPGRFGSLHPKCFGSSNPCLAAGHAAIQSFGRRNVWTRQSIDLLSFLSASHTGSTSTGT